MSVVRQFQKGAGVAVLTLAVLSATAPPGGLLPGPVVSAKANAAVWDWPVDAPQQLVRPFEAPATRYAAGHRGIDLAAQSGDLVYAPADGIVSFTGFVVDRPLLSVAHDGDLRSSFEPVLALVTEGQRVVRGQPIGEVSIRTGLAPLHCPQSCMHFGVRLHGHYVSPLLLLDQVPRAVLLPLLASGQAFTASPGLDRPGLRW